MINIEDLTIGYKNEPLIKVTLSLPQNGIFAVVGRNGSGKSSFYKTLMGILPPLSGNFFGITKEDVLLISDSTDIPAEVSLKDLCDLLLVAETEIEEILNIKLDSIFDKPIKYLSSGQKKMAEISLGLLRTKKLLLLDEASNSLDDESTYQFHEFLLKASESALILYTTHNLQEIVDLRIPLLCIKNKGITLHEPAKDVNMIREYIGINGIERG